MSSHSFFDNSFRMTSPLSSFAGACGSLRRHLIRPDSETAAKIVITFALAFVITTTAKGPFF